MDKPNVVYTAHASATGGRDGRAVSSDNVIDLKLSVPKEMGGGGGAATNPEQLFAAGYSACFDSALNLVINKSKIKTGETTVTADVSIGQIENGGFGLAVELEVNIPGVSIEEAQELTEKAHQICPYSNATRNNIDVKLTVTNN